MVHGEWLMGNGEGRRAANQAVKVGRAMGGRARAESLRLAGAIRNNFDYVRAMHRLKPPARVHPTSTCTGPLPGLYGPETRNV